MSSLLVVDGETTTDFDTAVMSSLNDVSSPVELPQHITNGTTATSAIHETLSGSVTAGVSEAMNGKFGLFAGSVATNPTTDSQYNSQVSLASTKVNACDITLAVEDPFAAPIEQLTVNDSDNVEQQKEPSLATTILLPEWTTDPHMNADQTINNGFGVTLGLTCDITLAIEDPFAAPMEQLIVNDTDNVEQEKKTTLATTILLPEWTTDPHMNAEKPISNDVALGRIDGDEGSQLVNTMREDQSQLYPYTLSHSEKSIPVKEIVVDTSDDAVLSLSSSRHVPVTAETAVTVDSSPSLQRGTTLYVSRAVRRNEPERPSSSIASLAANQEYSVSTPIERQADVHAITDNILAAAACVADKAVWSDSGRPIVDLHSIHDNCAAREETRNIEQILRKKRPRPGSGNCPARLNAYLKERNIAAPVMIFQLTDFPPDDFTLNIFEHQIIHIPWNSPGQHAMSETPCIRTMLHICYALSAWLHNNPTSVASMSSSRSSRHYNGPVAIVSCTNGKTRTAIAISCYLKFVGIVDNVQSGFCHFLERRCGREILTRSPESMVSDLPASLHTFFRNFDNAVELGGYMNYKPLLLKAITVQGVPLEDLPCLDLWDSSGHHVYSSHPHLWSDLDESNSLGPNTSTSQWADEEGFFRVNRVIQGDFCILCRFGGVYAPDIADSSKILFRYANSTAFMGAASPYELQYHHVDIQRRYLHYFDDEDFLLTLLFDAHWNSSEPYTEILSVDCSDNVLPAVASSNDAKELGWRVITQYHTAKPNMNDINKLTTESLGELDGCPNHLVSLALQLANFDHAMAQTILLEGRLRSWWQPQQDDLSIIAKDEALYATGPTTLDDLEPLSQDEAIGKIREVIKLATVDKFESRKLLFGEPQYDSRTSNAHSTSAKVNNESYYISPIMRPNSGDIVSALYTTKVSSIFHNSDPSFMGDRPIFPVIPRRRKRGIPIPIEHPDNNSAVELLLKMVHPGVYLRDLSILRESLLSVTSVNANVSHLPVEAVESHKTSTVANNILSNGVQGTNKLPTNELNGAREGRLQVDDSHLVETSLLSVAQTNTDFTLTDDVPIKDDPAYQKYFKMKKMGIPDGAVRNSMIKDGVDTSVLDFDPERSVVSQTNTQDSRTDDVPIIDDPAFQKYFKMKKLGIPDGAVRNAMIKDGVDTSVMDLDPERSFKSQTNAQSSGNDDLSISKKETGSDDVPIKDDPAFQKYFKMKKLGIPDGAIRNAMIKDGVDTSVMDLDPERSFKSQTNAQSSGTDDLPILKEDTGSDDAPIKDDAAFQKYFNMKKLGIPDGAIRNAMIKDGVDTSVMDLDPERSFKSQTNAQSSGNDELPIQDDPAYQKYFKMIKMGLPDGAVRNAMIKDNLDSSILDLDRRRSLSSQRPAGQNGPNFTLQDDPEWSKYFKMLRMGLPLGAVKNAADKDGKDSSILDLDHMKPINSQRNHSTQSKQTAGLLQRKKPVKRKKIFWNPLNSGQIKADSLWSNVKGRLQMSQLKYDEKEFAELFTESTDPTDKPSANEKKKVKTKAKKSVQVIDGKRSMNGGIILARLKLEYNKIAEMVETMSIGKLDSTSLTALKEMLPTPDERKSLIAFVERFGSAENEKQRAYDAFSECEKYMYSMIPVSNASANFDCMQFRVQFQSRCNELLDSIEIVEKACDEVRASERLQTVMAMILTVVNQINTGGDGNEAAGFTLDALLKLNEAKAFDKKTSVLHYLVKLIKQNNESLLGLRDDLNHLKDAEFIVLDSLCSDIKALNYEIAPVRETVKSQADLLEEKGQLVQMSLKELTEQRTSVRTVASIPQYNKIDHHTGRTPMERFTLNAAIKIEDALLYTDKVKEKFAKVLEYFGEDANTASNDFFGTINSFLADFSKAVAYVHKEDLTKQREVAKENKRIQAAALKASIEKMESAMPQTKMPSVSGIGVIASLKGKSKNKAFVESSPVCSTSVTHSQADLFHTIPHERIQTTTEVAEGTCSVDILNGLAGKGVICYDTEKLQEWLTKVEDAAMPHKLSSISEACESSDSTIADDFHVTENTELKIDRRSEWLTAVRASMQKYKEQLV